MARISTDLAANVASRAWAGLLGLVFPPVYARLMGVEGYGLVGFYSTLTALFVVLDLGLARTVLRELAMLGSEPPDTARARDLVRTVEALIWGLGITFCIGLCVAAPWIARHWLGDARLDPEVVTAAIRIMGLVCAVSWPIQMYGQMLLGLRRQVMTSAITAAATTARTGGAAAALWLGPRTVTTFFVWTLVVTVAWCLVFRQAVRRSLGNGWGDARVRPALLTERWRMSLAVWIGSAAAVLMSQLDRLVGSSILTLREFGYYSLAVAAASGLQYLSLPVWNAVFPRLCQLESRPEAEERFFDVAVQIMCVLVIPAALVLTASADSVLLAWTGQEHVVTAAAPVLAGLAVGAMCTALAYIPVAFHLARGNASAPMKVNVLVLVCAAPVVLASGVAWGGQGLAWAMAGGATCSFIALALSVGSRQMRTMLGHIIVTAGAALTCISLVRWGWGEPFGRAGAAALVATQGALALAVAVSLAPALRQRLVRAAVRWKDAGAALP